MGAVRAWADGPLDDLTVVVLKQLARARAGAWDPGSRALKSPLAAVDTHG